MAIQASKLAQIAQTQNVPLVTPNMFMLRVDTLLAQQFRAPLQEMIKRAFVPSPRDFIAPAFLPVQTGMVDLARAQTKAARDLFLRTMLRPVLRKDLERLACDLIVYRMHDEDEEALLLFTTKSLKLPPVYMDFVGEALLERRWQRAETPYAYVRKAAHTLYHKEKQKDALLIDDRSRFMSFEVATGTSEVVLPEPNPFLKREIALDLVQAIKEVEFSPDQLQLIKARLRGYTQDNVGAYLGWEQRKVNAEWRALTRAYPKLRKWLA